MPRRISARSAEGQRDRPAIKLLTIRKYSPSEVCFDRLSVLLGGEHRLTVTVAKAHRCLGISQIEAKGHALKSRAPGKSESDQRQEKLAHD